MPACKNTEDNGSATMVAAKISAGVAPDVNLMEHVIHMPSPIANKELSPEAQNRGVSVHTKRTYVLQKFFLEKIVTFIDKSHCLYLVHNEVQSSDLRMLESSLQMSSMEDT